MPRPFTTIILGLCLGLLTRAAVADELTPLDQGISTGTVEVIVPGLHGDLWVGGDFVTIARTGASDLVAHGAAYWNGSAWSGLGTGTNGVVNAFLVTATGVYVGGGFTTVGTTSATTNASCIAFWNPTSGAWSALGQGINGQVFQLQLDNSGNLYAFGNFTLADGTAAADIAFWDGAHWHGVAGGPSGGTGIQAATPVSGGSAFWVGGLYTTSTAAGLFEVPAGGGAVVNAPNEVTGVQAIGVDAHGLVYAGGEFSVTPTSDSIATYNPGTATWATLGTGLAASGGNEGQVDAIAFDANNNAIVGGFFNSAGGVPVSNLAEWNPTTSTWSSYGGGSPGTVLTMARDTNGSMYIGGAIVEPGTGIVGIARIGPAVTTGTSTATSTATASGTASATGSASATGTATASATGTATGTTAANATTGGSSGGGGGGGGCGLGGGALGLLALSTVFLVRRRSRVAA